MCSRLSCSGLRSTGLLGGCRLSRRSYLRSDLALFSQFLSSVVITLVQLPTAVSAGAAKAGVRGGIGLCSCATSVITLVTVAAASIGIHIWSLTTDLPS